MHTAQPQIKYIYVTLPTTNITHTHTFLFLLLSRSPNSISVALLFGVYSLDASVICCFLLQWQMQSGEKNQFMIIIIIKCECHLLYLKWHLHLLLLLHHVNLVETTGFNTLFLLHCCCYGCIAVMYVNSKLTHLCALSLLHLSLIILVLSKESGGKTASQSSHFKYFLIVLCSFHLFF